MNCYIPYSDLDSSLISAYRHDFNKYKNLSAIIESVMNLTVEPEAKIHAIWYYSGYINSAAFRIPGLQTEQWSAGKYLALHQYLEPFLTGKQDFNFEEIVKGIQDFFAVEELEPEEYTSVDDIGDSIEDNIITLNKIAPEGIASAVDEIIANILENEKVLDPVIMDPQNTRVLQLLQNLLDQVVGMKDTSSKVTVINRIQQVINQVTNRQEDSMAYVSIRNAEGLGQYKGSEIYIMRKPNGERFEVYYDRGIKGYRYYAPGTQMHEIAAPIGSGFQITAVNQKNNVNAVNPNTQQLRINVETSVTGLLLGEAYNVNETLSVQEQLANELPLSSSFYQSVKIRATRYAQKVYMERLERILTMFPGIARNYETAERPSQDESLSAGKEPILTFIRPATGFTITVSNFKGDKSFDLQNFIDLAFVYSDNTVVPLNFDDPSHIEMLKNMLQVHTEYESNKFNDASNQDIENIKSAVLRYRAFEAEVNERLEKSPDEDVDIRDIFYKYYDMNNSVVRSSFAEKEKVAGPLSNFIAENNNGFPVNVQTYDAEGNPVGEVQSKKIAVILRKSKGTWVIEDTLNENEKIVGASGKQYKSVEIYLEQEEKTNFRAWIENIYPNVDNGTAAYIAFRTEKDRLIPVAVPVLYRQEVKTAIDVFDIAMGMQLAMNASVITKTNTAMADFNNKSWGFNIDKDGVRADIIQIPGKGASKQFAITFKMLESPSTTPEQRDAFNAYAKENMNILLSKDLLNNFFNLANQAMQKAGLTLDENASPEEIGKMAGQIARMLGNDPIVSELQEAYQKIVNSVRNGFSSAINKHDIDLSEGKIAAPLITPTFREYGLFDGESLKLIKRGQKQNVIDSYQKLESADQKKLSLTYRDPNKKIFLPKAVVRKASGVDVKESLDQIYEPKVNPAVPAVEPVLEPSRASIEDADVDSDEPYKLVQDLESFITLSEEDFQKEIEAMKALLPVFLEFKDMKDGLPVDGYALGYLQDRFMYLNQNLRARGVAYHEAFHGIFRRLLTLEQQAYYLGRAAEVLGDYKTDEKGKYITVNGTKIYANDFRMQRRYLQKTDEQIRNLIYEEYLADSFADYMLENKVPKTWMQKLFAFLKRMLNMFKKGDKINALFYDISVGKFRTATDNGTKANHDIVFSLYKGIPTINDRSIANNKTINQEVGSHVVNELADKLTMIMARNKVNYPGLSLNELYDIAAEEVANDYVINDLISQKPELESEIRQAYETDYANARWLLGKFHTSDETFYLLNLSNEAQYDNYPVSRNTKLGKKQEPISQATAFAFKQDVINNFNSITVTTQMESVDEMEDADAKDEMEQEGGESFVERSSIGVDPGEGTAAFRQLFKYVSYEYTDPRFGVKRRKMVNSGLIFSTIRKITTNLDKDQIVFRIAQEIERLTNELDYFETNLRPKLTERFAYPEDMAKTLELRNSLKAIFDTLNEMCGLQEVINNTGEALAVVPTKNIHTYIQFANVFHTIDARLMQVEVITTEDWVKDEKGKSQKTVVDQAFLTNDIVVGSDLNKIRENIKNRIRLINLDPAVADAAIKQLMEIRNVFASESALKERFFTENGLLNDALFKEFIDNVYLSLNKFNLGIPYDAISTTMAYNLFKITGRNANIFTPTSEFRYLLRANKSFFLGFEQLEPTFYSDMIPGALKTAMELSTEEKANMTSEKLENLLRRIGTAYTTSLGEFLLKYDPTISGSVTRNANGDLVNKYCKPTPAYVAVLKMQSSDDIGEGLDKLISDYYSGFEQYFRDNPMLNPESPVIKDFLNNFTVSAYAGFQQKFNGITKKAGETTTFKGIDDRAYVLSMFGLFMDRSIRNVPGTTQKYETFKRILTQYEATSTSIVVDGIYKKYVDDTGKVFRKEGVPLHVLDLMKIVEQEYNLMRKNFKELKLNKQGKLYVGYNIKETDRGFTFNILKDFFQAGIDTKNPNSAFRAGLRDELIAAAKEGISLEAELASNPELKKSLAQQLEQYAKEQLMQFKMQLVVDMGIDGPDLPRTAMGVEGLIQDFFYNNWINGAFVNQIFDGPIAVGVKDFASFFKRQKAGAAAGDNIFNVITGKKTYRAAVVKTIQFYVDDADLTKPAQLTPFLDANGQPLSTNKLINIFDGQSVNSIDRRIKIAEALGQLDHEAADILRKMRYMTESSPDYESDIEALRERGIVFNSLKTVTAAGLQYIKQSEHTLIRKDVSVLKEGYRGQQEIELANLYSEADYYRDNLENGVNYTVEDPETGVTRDYETLYRETMEKIHSYFEPIKGREFLHNMLNSMEYHRVDQFMDNEASKKATVGNAIDKGPLTIDLARATTEEMIFDLDLAIENLPNDLTYLQVSTQKSAEVVTQGIQQKLLAIAQMDPNSEEYKAIKEDLDGYQKGLADAVAAQTKTIMRLLSTSDKQVVSSIFRKIGDGLRQQGADSTMLQWFELKDDGTPKYDPDLALISKTVVYYYYSLFNKNIFDKKITGRKFYHVSPLGYQIIEMEDENGNKRIITQDEYKKNPARYKKATTRYPAVTREPDGTYVVEVILPKEFRNLDQKFAEEYLSKFFGTRIPTEGIRSMVVAKVVDYIDEAYSDSIIIPYQLHMLAGSDFDIDAFYAHVKSSYRAADGQKVVYGDYSHYKSKYGMNESEGKFMEYLTYMSQDSAIEELINTEIANISLQSMVNSDLANRVGEFFGGKLQKYFDDNADLLTYSPEKKKRRDVEKADAFKRLVATFNVLQRLKSAELPYTPQTLEKYTTAENNPVVNVTFNKILQHKINILSNDKVYERFMADTKQRADAATQVYERLTEMRGLSEKDLYNKQNLYTPTALIVARSLNSESKDSLGIAASFNKGVSMLNTIKAILKAPISTIYSYDENNNLNVLVKTDRIVDDAVQLVGGAIGLFADAPKNPFPGPLHLNNITTPVMCAMYAVGVPQEAAIMFQSIPVIRKLIQSYNQTFGSVYSQTSAISTSSFNRYMKNSIDELEDTLFDELLKKGIISISESGKTKFEKKSYKLVWTGDVKPDTKEQLAENAVPIENFGYQLLDKNGNAFSKEIQDYILLKEFSNYSGLANEISFKITRLTDALKGIKPDNIRFDTLLNTYRELIERPESTTYFAAESIEKLFEQYPVLMESYKTLEYMDETGKMLMMERTSFIKGFVSLFGNIWGYDNKDINNDIKAFIQMQLQKAVMETSPKDFFSDIYLGLLDARTFLSGDIISDLNGLKTRYPNNAFLNELTIKDEGNRQNPNRVIEIASSKLSKNKREDIYNDFMLLLREKESVKQMAFRLAYYGMIKSGGQKAQGGFYELLPGFMSLFMSDALGKFRKDLVELDKIITKMHDKTRKKTEDGQTEVSKEVQEEYDRKIGEILSRNFNGVSFAQIITQAVSKIVSMKLSDGTIESYKRVINLEKLNQKSTSETFTVEDLVDLVNTIAPKSAGNIIDEKGNRPNLKLPTKFYSGINEIDLFVPEAESLSIDLTKVNNRQVEILNSQGIFYDGSQFSFPLYRMNVYGQMMVLTKLNGKSIGEAFIDNIGATDFKGTTNRAQLKGTTAEYTVAGLQGSPKISPIAFSSEQGVVIHNMTKGMQQLSSQRRDPLPMGARIVRSSNRMYLLSPQFAGTFTNKTFQLADLSTVTTNDKVNRFELVYGDLWLFPQNGKNGNKLSPDQLEKLANALGKSAWEEVKLDPGFEDLFAGKTKLFMYQLNNGDIQSPTAQPVTQPTQPSISVKPIQGSINIYAGTGENAELSNFAVRPFTYKGIKYNTVEGAFQAAKLDYAQKSQSFNDEKISTEDYKKGFSNLSGNLAKQQGRSIKGLNKEAWDANSSRIMKELILESFKQNPNALAKLLATGNATLTHTQDKGKWGKEFPRLLMEVRNELRTTQLSTQPVAPASVKPGVQELFESNPELANAVYEALGFKTIPSDISKIKDFEGTIIEYVEHIGTHKDGRGIGARNINKGEKIQVVLNEMRKKFEEKSWVNPVNSEPLSQDVFSSFEELMMFMYLHEKAHEYILQEEGESLKSYETRVNNEALKRLNSEFKITSQQKQQAQQQYSQYLDTIFPDSKVKDIVYHDGGHGKIKEEGFRKDLIGISDGGVLGNGFYFYFDRTKKYAEQRSNTESVLLNVKNVSTKAEILKSANLENGLGQYEKALSKLSGITVDAKIKGIHGKYIGNYADALTKIGVDAVKGKYGTGEEIVVFEPEQIHILGNKQDIEGFKEFVSGKPEAPAASASPSEQEINDVIRKKEEDSQDCNQ